MPQPTPPAQAPPTQAQFNLDWLLRRKPYLLLSSLKTAGDHNISSLAKKSGMSYVHAIELMKLLESKGIVATELKGNKRIVKLTEGGAAVASVLDELVKKTPQNK